MTYQCGYNGEATVERINNSEPFWTKTDERIHIVRELVDDPTASAHIGQRYEIGAWCPEANAFHAVLIEGHAVKNLDIKE